jgi:hypothetical protein
VLVEEGVSVGVPVEVGAGSSRVGVAGRVGVRVGAAREGVMDGIAVGGRRDRPISLDKKIHPMPRIETRPMAIGIKRERSNERRVSILPRFYPQSFHYGEPGIRYQAALFGVLHQIHILNLFLISVAGVRLIRPYIQRSTLFLKAILRRKIQSIGDGFRQGHALAFCQ